MLSKLVLAIKKPKRFSKIQNLKEIIIIYLLFNYDKIPRLNQMLL